MYSSFIGRNQFLIVPIVFEKTVGAYDCPAKILRTNARPDPTSGNVLEISNLSFA